MTSPVLIVSLLVSLLYGGLVVAASVVLTRAWWSAVPWLAPAYGLLNRPGNPGGC